MTKKLTIEKQDDAHCVATSMPLILGMFRTSVPHESVALQIALQKKAIASGSYSRLGCLNVIETGCAAMPPATREIISEWSKQPDFGKVLTANVIEEEGIKGVMLRAVLRTIGLAIPRESRAMIFSTVPEAIRWLIAEMPPDNLMSFEDISDAITHLRRSGSRRL